MILGDAFLARKEIIQPRNVLYLHSLLLLLTHLSPSMQALIRKAIFESALALGTLSFLPGVNALAYASTIKMLLGKLRE